MLIRRIRDGSIMEINAVDSRLKMASEAELLGDLEKANKLFKAALFAEKYLRN